jgi:hypothetical protein
MEWKQKVEYGLKSGMETSKKIFEKARDKAKDIGDYGVLSLEVKQLQGKHDDLIARLGSLTFHLLEIEGKGSISSRTPELKELLSEIAATTEMLSDKREAMKRSDEHPAEEKNI